MSIQKLRTFGKKASKVTLAAGVAMVAAPSFASNTDAINAAVTGASADVALVTAGVISVAALGFGLGMVVSWLRK